ncbi:tyrosine-type recombinase/integrase [Streptomyces sp. rh34]|uniref:tyrosine-type recombinase/integrase n=1 Tax=Streptomyces sp. rh34 TaxID=2034272 RepID=UPI000BEF2B2C|nr:site-specific integrase [Streptomyces sp. rh34]
MYDVKIWGIRKRPDRAAAYQLRWRAGAQPFSKSYKIKARADGRRAELLTALRNRERFDTDSGLPESEVRALESPTWFAHARAYAEMKWPAASAKHRASIADALATVTSKLVKDSRGAPAPEALRAALYAWSFRFVRGDDGVLRCRLDVETPPADIMAALDWIERKSVDIADLSTPSVVRSALNALKLKMDGTPAAENTVRRKLPVFRNCLRYAVERELLTKLPLGQVDWSPPGTDDEIDFRFVPGPRLAEDLIDTAGRQGKRGQHLKAFYGCLYYAANRPGEATGLRENDFVLPEEGWGEVILSTSTPRVGSGWTDTGESFDTRGLKKRARKATRSVPIPPVLVHLVREHIKQFGTAEDGRLFRAVQGGHLLSKEYGEIWQAARREVLTEAEVGSPLADVPYSLRHAGVSLWLDSGVPPAEVARRAGHSIAVLFRFYAKAIQGNQDHSNRQIERSLDAADRTQREG